MPPPKFPGATRRNFTRNKVKKTKIVMVQKGPKLSNATRRKTHHQVSRTHIKYVSTRANLQPLFCPPGHPPQRTAAGGAATSAQVQLSSRQLAPSSSSSASLRLRLRLPPPPPPQPQPQPQATATATATACLSAKSSASACLPN